MRLGRQLVVAGIAVSALGLTRQADAADSRFSGDDVRITVDEAGVAQIEHSLTYRVTGALPKGFDLNGVEPEAALDPSASMSLDGEPSNAARLDRKSERALHVTLDVPPRKASSRTVVVVHVRYTVDLVQTRELTLDGGGAMWRLGWTAPVAPEGYDAGRVVFDLPAAPTEPRAIASDGTGTGTSDDASLVTLRRGPERDELELSRPHVAKVEAAQWAARVDPRAFPRVTDPSLRPRPPPAQEPAKERSETIWLVAAFVGLFFGTLAHAKGAAFARACKARGVVARAHVLQTLPPSARAWLAGGAMAAGIAAEWASLPVVGALGIVVAMLFATVHAPAVTAAPRGPGQWLALSPAEAFAPRGESLPLALVDVATLAGKATLLVLACASVAVGLALRPIDVSWAWLVPLDALALLPLFVTGSRAQLPPDRVRSPRGRLEALHRLLKRKNALRVAPWARVPTGASSPDELRLLVLPRAPMPGVIGIEVGVAWIATPAGYAPETEVLVRVREATAAAARMVALAPARRAVPGRKTDERVVRLVPAVPSRAGAVALIQRLTSELHDRRKSLPGISWPGAERRLPSNERLKGSVPAAA
ncbi:MAG: hypothetical protein ACLQVI_29270 [Polyangiaceae bacterium]